VQLHEIELVDTLQPTFFEEHVQAATPDSRNHSLKHCTSSKNVPIHSPRRDSTKMGLRSASLPAGVRVINEIRNTLLCQNLLS
jgi:hypothetical protein